METRDAHFWLEHYPDGVPADIDPDAYRSLVQLLEASMTAHADRKAVVCLGRSMTYGELNRLSRDMAAWLQSLGLQAGSRVALMMPNCLPYVVSLFGVLRAGFVVVNVNPLYTPRELAVQLKDSGAEVIVVLENFGATLAQVLAGTSVRQVVLVSMGDLQGWLKGRVIDFMIRRVKKMVPPFEIPGAWRFADVMTRGKALRFEAPGISGEQLAFLQYTGGTTGVPKGAMLTHRNMVANVLQDEAWFYPAMRQPGRPAPAGPLPPHCCFGAAEDSSTHLDFSLPHHPLSYC